MSDSAFPLERQRVEGRRRHARRPSIGCFFVVPVVAIQALVVIGPAIGAAYLSLTDWSGFGGAQFIGTANYERMLFEDSDFWQALLNNLSFIAFFDVLAFSLALLAATALARVSRGGLVFRMVLFLPYMLPSVVVANIWQLLLSPTQGVGALLATNGIAGFDTAYFADPSTAIYAIAFVDMWHFWGFLMIIFLAAMQGVPKEYYEAARLDGAGRVQEFRFLTLPLIRPTVVFMILMTTVWGLLVFEYIWILTQGGPAGSTNVLGVLVYKRGILSSDAAYGAAIGLSMSVLVGIVIVVFLLLRRRWGRDT